MKALVWIFSIILFLILVTYTAFKVSPMPSVLLIRKAFKDGGTKTNEALAKHVPDGITENLNLKYDDKFEETLLDVYYPVSIEKSDSLLPVIFWIHGGGWVAGDKSELANYCKIITSNGYVVVSVNYSLAPGEKFPMQIIQLNHALAFLKKNSKQYHIDTSKIFLAGDSGGAHLATVLSNVISVPSYADILKITPSISRNELKGAILFCGPYDLQNADFEGPNGGFMRTVLWSLSGKKDFQSDKKFSYASIINFVNSDFPPAFISVGNADPLKGQSELLSRKLSSLNVMTDTLYFPENYSPPLQHEYQFDLDSEAGKQALERLLRFVN